MPLTEQASAFVSSLALAKPPGWHEMSPPEAREIFNGFVDAFGPSPELRRVENRAIHWDEGEVRVRVFSDVDGPAPGIMYFHGGGWVLGNIETHDALCRRIAKASKCVVISVDYRLSPEHPFPGPLQDCVEASRYVAEHADQFGVLADKLVLMGDSAGGNLAAATALRFRDQNGPPIALQVLIYPVIARCFETQSYQDFCEGYGLTMKSMQWFWEQYMGDQAASEWADPSMATSLSGLPPAHVVTAEYDVLRDEGERFAHMLMDAGVTTTLRRYDGNLHGFIHFAGLFDDGLRAVEEISQTIQSQLST